MNTLIKVINTINPQTVKANQNNPFTTTMPSLEHVTERYAFISTAQFIQDVQSFGYTLDRTSAPRRGLGMHSMTFSHADMPKIDGLEMRFLATNSHNGTSAFRLYIQILVQVCSNGLVAWQSKENAKVIHRGYALDKVQDALTLVRSQFDSTLQTVEQMKQRDVSPESGAEFLKQAVELRDARPFAVIDLQRVQHREQTENNAWNVFNRVQESVIRGGYRTVEQAQYDMPRQGIVKGQNIPGRKARELTAIRDKVNVNTKLWQIAVETLLKA